MKQSISSPRGGSASQNKLLGQYFEKRLQTASGVVGSGGTARRVLGSGEGSRLGVRREVRLRDGRSGGDALEGLVEEETESFRDNALWILPTHKSISFAAINRKSSQGRRNVSLESRSHK